MTGIEPALDNKRFQLTSVVVTVLTDVPGGGQC